MDPRTVFVIFTILQALMTLQLVVAWRSVPQQKALAWWAAASALATGGFLLSVLRGTIPDWVSIWFGNTMFAASFLGLWGGIRVFDGLAPAWRVKLAILTAFGGCLAALLAAGVTLNTRAIVISGILTCLAALCARALLGSGAASGSRRLAAGLTLLYSAVYALRTVLLVVGEPQIGMFEMSALMSVLLVVAGLAPFMMIIALLAMPGERAHAEVAAANREVKRASDAKSFFLSRLAHELRTPLNAIVGLSDVIKQEAAQPGGNTRHAEYAGHIGAAADHVVALSNELLDVARIESGTVALDFADIDVAQSLAAVATMLDKALRDRGAALETEIAPALPALRADPRAFRQILLNVAGNAVKFSPAGGRVRIAAYAQPGWLHVGVEDGGPGIPPDEIRHVFTPFLRAANAGKTEGAGLGLAIVKGLMDAHGGKIEIDSKLGAGTRVTLRFPAAA